MKIKNIKYFRAFTSIDLILTLSIMFTIISIVTPIILNGIESTQVERAKKEIRILAHESAFLPLVGDSSEKNIEKSKDRSVASANLALYEKSLGLDPWGRPYRKNVIRDLKGKPTQVIVWSLGPNGVAESIGADPDYNPVHRGRKVSHRFGGDDFGISTDVAK